MKNSKNVWWIGSIILVALGLRLYKLGAESFWIDEGFSLRDAMNLTFIGGTRPLYFIFLAGWMDMLGPFRSEFLLRLPSALFGTAGVWVLYALGRRLIDSRTALLASAFMAVSVLQINHSREVRMYSLTVLLTLLATYFLVLALEEGKFRHYAGYALCAFGSLLTHPLSLLILSAHGLYLILYVRAHYPRSLAFLGILPAIMAVWAPWFFNSMESSTGYKEGYTSILKQPDHLGVVEMTGKFFLWKWSDPGQVLALGALGFSLIVLAAALYSLKDFHRTDNGLTLSIFWLAVPLIGIIVMSYTVSNMWMVHYLIPASPALFLLVSKGIFTIRRKWVAWIVAGVIFILTIGRLGLYFTKNMRPEWRAAVTYIQEHEQPGDFIGIYYSGNRFVFDYYYHGKSKWSPIGSDVITSEHFSGWDDSRVKDLLKNFPASGDRFWVVLSNHDYAGGSVIVDYLSRNYQVLEHRYYSQIEMLLINKRE